MTAVQKIRSFGWLYLICASNEPKSVLARGSGDCRDNLRNSRSVLLIIMLIGSVKRIEKDIKRVKRERVYQGTIVDVYKDYMEFSNGNHEVWDYIHHKGAAAVIPVMDDGRLLMVRQYRNALDRFTLELPAGGLDQADEPGRDCSARELEEETGYRSDDLEWLITLRTTVALCNEKIEVYVARNLIRTHQHLDENEFVNIEAHTVEELKQMIFEGKIEDSKTAAAILAYDAKYNR